MKGEVKPEILIIGIVVVLITAFILIYAIGKNASSFNEGIIIASKGFKIQSVNCKLDTVVLEGRDFDGDGYSDNCDICMGGDDSIDVEPDASGRKTGDGIPDKCQEGADVITDDDLQKEVEKLKNQGVKDGLAHMKALLLKCKHPDQSQVICCTDKFWDATRNVCGLAQLT